MSLVFLTNLIFLYHLSYFTGCVSADESANRLFISDCNHHRIIVCDGNAKIIDCVSILINYFRFFIMIDYSYSKNNIKFEGLTNSC